METIFPRSLCGTFAVTLAATSSALLLAVISAALAGSLSLVEADQNSDDRGSGRVSQDTSWFTPGLLAIRGSGRVGSDPNQTATYPGLQTSSQLAWRGSGRINEDPAEPNALGAFQA